MFDQNEDFDIDEDFLNTSTTHEIISSTQFPNNTEFVFRKNTVNSVPAPAQSSFKLQTSPKPINTNIFSTDDLADDSFDLDEVNLAEQSAQSSQPNKRTFSQLISDETKTPREEISKLRKFDFTPVKRPIENIVQMIQNDPVVPTSLFRTDVQNSSYEENQSESNKKLKQLTNSEQNIHSNKSIIITKFNSKPLVQKRKFPGPAGLLPEINSVRETVNLKLPDLEDELATNITILHPICSQNSENLFTKGPWKRMLNDYGSDDSNQNSLPGKFTISWLKSTANVKQLIQQKSPFLAAIIDSINDNLNLTLKDQTGEIDGVLETEVWDTYGNVLSVGSVLVLRQVGVLTFSAKRHYLNITANTIVIIYTNNEENSTVDITKGAQYVSLADFTNSISNVRHIYEQKRQNNFVRRDVNLSVNKPSSSDVSRFNNLNLSNRPQLNGRNNVPVTPPTFKNVTKSVTNVTNQMSTTNPTSRKIDSPTPNFNFAKSKLSNFSFASRNGANKNKQSNAAEKTGQEDNSEIESIISSTFNGIDTDSFFDDF